MKIIQITVSYGETQSLPEYSNVKPALTLTATLDEGDDPTEAEQLLWAHAKDAVHSQVDSALEANDRPAKYSSEPRYQVMRTYNDAYGVNRDKPKLPIIVVILPNDLGVKERFDNRFVHAGYHTSRDLRYAHAMKVAQKAAIENTADLIDCADGDLSRLEAALAVAPEPEPPF